MDDRELLELAALAAGVKIIGEWSDTQRMYTNGVDGWWKPLTDDGDALRLAVKLGILEHAASLSQFQNESDPYDATRRVIVRAAAEIGKSMSGQSDHPAKVA